ncbi:MAG: NPCBM/NEW2 domain-containing protein [Planctomycetaceae bacterium]|nr:NPCBM/NEW2 domain-containing protein [Planctomycetaceae bacterium]
MQLYAAEPNEMPLRAVYFVPSDAEPLPDRQERLGRVMKYVQDFYRKGMFQNRFGNKTFALEWDKPARLKLYTVNGKKRQTEYGRSDAWVVRDEVRDALKSKYGIDINDEVVVIFQVLLKWENGKAVELGPYVGSGSPYSGTAWVYDDKRLDAALLSSTEPGGYYGRPCSIGQFNTHYIGGIAHELGHAFSLPHECENDEERKTKGYSLMGGGNHTFGQELRHQGLGTFLSPASALRLSKVRAFSGDLPGMRERAYWTFKDLKAVQKDKTKNSFVLSGRVEASPKLAGIIAYNDNGTIGADYDAKTFVGEVSANGTFQVDVKELENVPYQLRLCGVHENGAVSVLSADYAVKDGIADLSAVNSAVPLDILRKLFRVGNTGEIENIARKYADDEELQAKCRFLIRLLNVPKTFDAALLPEDVRRADLSFADFTKAETGWGNFRRAHVPEDVFIQIGKTFFDSGLYAHAPSVYKIELRGKWTKFDFVYGLQNGYDGPVRFALKGDGKEWFRSDVVKDHNVHRQSVNIKDVQTLELLTESAAENGNSGAWAVWAEPVLSR